MSDKNRRQLILWVFVGGGLIFVLVIVLVALLIPRERIPENAFRADAALIEGEKANAETLARINEIMAREPILRELPLTVEFYSDDLSFYTKYILSYEYDFNSARGFYIIMKDYTEAGLDAGISKLAEMGMNVDGVEIKYENLAFESLSPRAEE